MKKSLSLLLISSALFANNEGYIPLSKFSENQKLEYNFDTLKVPQKKEETYKKVEIKKENKAKIVKVEDIKAQEKLDVVSEEPKLTSKKELVIPKKEVIKKETEQIPTIIETKQKEVKPQTFKEQTIIKKVEPIKLSVQEEKTSFKPTILSKTNEEASSQKDFTDDLKVDLRFEYSPVNTKYSLNSGQTIDKSSDSFSPILTLSKGKDSVEFDYFMTDKTLETTWYKLKYKRQINDIKVGFGINRYEISVENSKANEDYLSLEIEQTKELDKFFVNYGGSLGKNSAVDAHEYFLSLGYKNSAIYNSSYLLGYKSKTIKDDIVDITYSGPFIGVNTTF